MIFQYNQMSYCLLDSLQKVIFGSWRGSTQCTLRKKKQIKQRKRHLNTVYNLNLYQLEVILIFFHNSAFIISLSFGIRFNWALKWIRKCKTLCCTENGINGCIVVLKPLVHSAICIIYVSMSLSQFHLRMWLFISANLSVWRNVQQIGVEKCWSNYAAEFEAGAITSDCIDRLSSLADIKSDKYRLSRHTNETLHRQLENRSGQSK